MVDDYDYEEYDEDEDEDGDSKRKRRSSADDLGFDPSIDLYPGDYCNIIQDLTESKCFENSLLELWSEDNYGGDTEELLQTITQEEIIRAVNEDTFSKELGFDQDFAKYLGGVERNSTGHIVAAKATFMRFFGKVNVSAITKEELSRARLGSPVDGYTLRWETSLIETLTAGLGEMGRYELFTNVAKSFSDLSSEAIEGDAFFFGCGTVIMFVYVQFMLGKFNLVEQRVGDGRRKTAMYLILTFSLASHQWESAAASSVSSPATASVQVWGSSSVRCTPSSPSCSWGLGSTICSSSSSVTPTLSTVRRVRPCHTRRSWR